MLDFFFFNNIYFYILKFINILISLFIFFFIIFFKNRSIKNLNHFFSIILFLTYFLIIFNCIPFLKKDNLLKLDFEKIFYTFPVIITSFGFSIIVPTIVNFLKKDKIKIYRSIIIGSLIPLIIYILWIITIIGIFEKNNLSLIFFDSILKKDNFDINFIHNIKNIIGYEYLSIIIIFFSISCIFTSIFGVTLSLSDFLKDSFKIKKNINIFLIISIPSIFFFIFYNSYFTNILRFSGIIVSILLGIIPIINTYYGRYFLKINSIFIVPGGKIMLSISFCFFVFIIFFDSILNFF